jgi:hypothetical protein
MESKFNLLIHKNGIPKYVKKWIPASKTFTIEESLKTYHKHSFITFFNRYLNNSTLFAFSNVKLKKTEKGWMNLENSKIKYNTQYLKDDKKIIPIAVIVGTKTSSSGEFAAALFKGRKNVKFFGNRTAGYLSSNQNFKISKDIEIILTNKLITTYDGIFNDEEFLNVDKKTDKPITESKLWIKKQKR